LRHEEREESKGFFRPQFVVARRVIRSDRGSRLSGAATLQSVKQFVLFDVIDQSM